MKPPRKRRTTTQWDMPTADEAQTALNYFNKQHSDSIKRKNAKSKLHTTLITKAHNLSTKKIRQLLETHVHLTNLTADISDEWYEDPAHPRSNGPIAACFAVETEGTFGSYRSRVLSGKIEPIFEPHHHDSAILPRIRTGTYRDVAQSYMGTMTKLSNRIRKELPEGASLDISSFYNHWKRLREKYQRAMEIVLALSNDPGSPYHPSDSTLLRQAKGEAKQLLANLRPEAAIRKALEAVDAMIEHRQDDEQAYTPHLYQKGKRHQRSIRQNWLLHYATSADEGTVDLSSLHKNELTDYRKKLLELLAILERAQHMVETRPHIEGTQEASERTNNVHTDSTDTAQTTIVNQIRSDLETFLFNRPESFPTAHRVAIINDPNTRLGWRICDAEALKSKKPVPQIYEQLVEAHHKALEWFQHYGYSAKKFGQFASAEQEAKTVQNMFTTLRHLKPPRLSPITFIGTMSPTKYVDGKRKGAQYRDCALLFEQPIIDGVKTTRFIFAAFLNKRREITSVEIKDQERRAKQHADYKKRRLENPMYHINAPYTPFQAPDSHDVLLLPLECGENYANLLMKLIEQQRKAQRVAYKTAENVPIERCMPVHAPIKSARITCDWDQHGEPEFYIHLHIILPDHQKTDLAQTPHEELPLTYLGVTLREGRPAYSVVTLDGTVLSAADIYIPASLDPEALAQRVSDNLLHWIANSIVARAVSWNAIIGIEDTSYQSNTRGTTHYHAPFELPLKRIYDLIKYKALRECLPEPRIISNISPVADCGTCQTRFASGIKTTLIAHTSKCKVCYRLSMQPLTSGEAIYRACNHEISFDTVDASLEQWFICPECQKPQLARHNRAAVTAKRTAIDLVSHATNSQALKAKNDRQDDHSGEGRNNLSPEDT